MLCITSQFSLDIYRRFRSVNGSHITRLSPSFLLHASISALSAFPQKRVEVQRWCLARAACRRLHRGRQQEPQSQRRHPQRSKVLDGQPCVLSARGGNWVRRRLCFWQGRATAIPSVSRLAKPSLVCVGASVAVGTPLPWSSSQASETQLGVCYSMEPNKVCNR